MEFRLLRTFLAVRQRGSFTQAAKELGVTQAAVSQQIAALESDLGVTLFDRNGRHISNTLAGDRLARHAEEIVRLVEQAKAELGKQLEASGLVRIASSTVPAQLVLPELFGRFRTLHPSVREEVVISDTADALAMVERGEADLGFVGAKVKSSSLNFHQIAEDELKLVATSEHPLADRRRLSREQLCEVPLIIRGAGSGSRQCLEDGLKKIDLRISDLTIAIEMNSHEAIRAAVQRGAGAAFLSSLAVAAQIDEGELVAIPVTGLKLKRNLYAVWPKKSPPSPAQAAWIEFLQTGC